MIAEKEIIIQTRDFFVTENILDPTASAADIAAFVHKSKTTGEVTYTTNKGGVRSVLVVERTKATEEEANAIRRIMGMVSE